ncbi:MAG: DNA polymerase ligase N-terminal domain-containing protein [Phycisphaerae bacterium]
MNRFVLLEHDTRPGRDAGGATAGVHWDLMLELAPGGGLATWRLAANPCDTGEPVVAERIGEHRVAYLDYEGDLSGGRGRVRQVDRGALEVRRVDADAVCVRIAGARLAGEYEIAGAPGACFLRRAGGAKMDA